MRFSGSNDEWAWRFKILEAEALLWQGGQYAEVLQELNAVPSHLADRNSAIRALTIAAAAHGRRSEDSAAAAELEAADRLCNPPATTACGELLATRGSVAVWRGDLGAGEAYFQKSLAFARAHGDPFLESDALLNLGEVCSRDGRLDEAVDWSTAAYQGSAKIGALDLVQTALGNLGVAYYNLGDSDRALENFNSAAKTAAQLGDMIGELIWLRHAAQIYADRQQAELANKSYGEALDLARKSGETDEVYTTLRSMARLYLRTGNLEEASRYATMALQIARDSHKHADELNPRLVQGQVAALHGDIVRSQQILESVEGDLFCPPPLRWEAQHALARLFEDRKQFVDAERAYHSAISTFESARDTVIHDELRLPFIKNGKDIYDDYVHFLVAQGKTEEALRWADYSRARTLLEGLGLLDDRTHGDEKIFNPPYLNSKTISAARQGTLLYYWLGEKQSYLWAITPKRTQLFTLPPRAEIEAMADRYRKAVTEAGDVLASRDQDGQGLYRTLVQPARLFLPKNGRVIIIPDGKLNNLNFESLIAPAPAPHYWIEDVTISSASSLRILTASQRSMPQRKLNKILLIGDSATPSEEYPALPNAKAQMDSVARHFREADRQIIDGAQATPAAYLASHPERFSLIHFVAHGTASRLSPLDSAIILSKDSSNRDAFKLYARDIITYPLRADLVTVSACYGAGERTYSGEGLVGLSWAFLRAGAHRVVAALWDVADASTARLMDRFYDELDKGSAPDAALRAAKLSLLHDTGFRSPYYWAPFQLYSGM